MVWGNRRGLWGLYSPSHLCKFFSDRCGTYISLWQTLKYVRYIFSLILPTSSSLCCFCPLLLENHNSTELSNFWTGTLCDFWHLLILHSLLYVQRDIIIPKMKIPFNPHSNFKSPPFFFQQTDLIKFYSGFLCYPLVLDSEQ